jgi:hypothetical protein
LLSPAGREPSGTSARTISTPTSSPVAAGVERRRGLRTSRVPLGSHLAPAIGAITLSAFVAMPMGSRGTGTGPHSFCAAVRSFNATHSSSKADSGSALRRLAQASPSDVKPAVNRIARALEHGDPAAVLVEATAVQAVRPTPLTVAGGTVDDASNQRCHVAVNLLAAVPRGVSKTTVAVKAWTRTVCTKLAAWGSSLRDSGSNLATPTNGITTTLSEVRSALSQFIATSAIRTQELVDGLDQAGIPKAAHGAAVASYLQAGVSRVQQAFAAMQPAAQALPDDPRAFQVAAQALVQRLDNAGKQVQALVHDAETSIRDRTLDRAFGSEPACAGIG